MSRVSTYGNYQSALMNMMAAQQRNSEAQDRVSTKKNATDLHGFGRDAATVNALRTSQNRINAYQEVSKTVADRLEAQDLAMGRLNEAATNSRLAIANAIASGRTEGLMAELEVQFQIAQNALNTKHQGQYLFSGGVTDKPPVATATLNDLHAAGTTADAFENGYLRQSSRVDENVVMDTGFLADGLGSEMFAVFKDLKALDAATPLTGTLDGATTTALTDLMNRFTTAATNVVNEQAKNGTYQQRVEKLIEDHQVRADSVEIMLGEKTDADMFKAVSELELSQIALQASAQVINQLRQVSLLDYLR
ncbi:flagellin [Brevundimonas sp.]|uniref:flagellin n=1 Tax=Brevundimonas sp. TaxID=1871086 RepID=UPI0028A21B3C|nr:flagellin [Brevundimonas sp.]